MSPQITDAVYNSVNGRELKLDLYRPEGGDVPTRTAVVLVHGGGWVFGERKMMEGLGRAFADQGFLAAAVEYRLVQEAHWPAQLDDVTAAVCWLAANASDLGIDSDRIVVAGGSAGAHLAMMTAATLKSPKVAAVLALFPASDLTVNPEPRPGVFNAIPLLGGDASDDTVAAASPLHRLDADYPPVFLLHGGKDWLIDPVASVRVYQKLVELGVPAELHIVANAQHEFVGEPGMTSPMVAEMALFLNRVLLDPERWQNEAEESNLFAKGPEVFQQVMAQMMEGLAEK